MVDVSSTGRVVVPSSASCPPGTIGDPGDPDADPPVPADFNATCKPITDLHQAAGPGKQNQLAYYSNYGPRIDIAGPGGARKFNLANFDRGGTPGFPYTLDDLTNAWEVFSTTSNWAVRDPLLHLHHRLRVPPGRVLLDHPGHLDGRAAGVRVAGPGRQRPPVAAQAPGGADRPAQARWPTTTSHNYTRALSATDTSPGDLTGLPCDIGFCHLSGPRISDSDAYGAGLVNVATP